VPLFVFVIVGSMLLGDAAFWIWADRRLRRARRPKVWRPLLGRWCAVMLAYLAWFVLRPAEARHAHAWMPVGVLAGMYVWHLLVLPATLVYILIESLVGGVARVVRTRRRRRSETIDAPDDLGLRDGQPAGITRRQALAAVATAAVPPLLTGVGVVAAMRQLPRFRVRSIDLALASLPPELDGITIAHVSDLHVGRFTREHMLGPIADATNSLRADLVCFTGDLIDLSLSDLPMGIDFMRRLDPRAGLFMCEGNHDLIENRFAFELEVRKAGLPLLLDEGRVVMLRGKPVQILGATWGRGDAAHVGAVSRLLPVRRHDAFQILLAHHPHAFDPAAAVGIPLTLSGHTHGGQLMLNERLGAGPAMFRYWSGVYRKDDAALVVSNGVGNWFPLRINAPAEIVHITLKSAAWEDYSDANSRTTRPSPATTRAVRS
jgi:predicted MPP superfamily phosphohydrolase